MRFGISSFITIAAAVGTVAAQRASLNPPLSSVKDIDFASLPPAPEPATNAKRLAQGLPPMSPRSRKHHLGSDKALSRRATRVASAPRSGTSPSVSLKRSCNILVKEAGANGRTYGYLGPKFNPFGQYGVLQPSQDGALIVSVSYTADSFSQLDLTAINSPSPAYTYVGGAMEFGPSGSDLAPKNPSYAYIAAIRQTPPGSPPVSDSSSYSTASGLNTENESAIWTYTPVTNTITAQWINSDGSAMATHLLYANDGNDALLLTGYPDGIRERFASNYPEVTFTCAVPKAT